MRSFKCIVLMLMLVGCRTIPHYPVARPYIEHEALRDIPRWGLEQNKGIYPPELVSEYLDFFIERWQHRGLPGNYIEIRRAFNKVELHWQQAKFVNPEEDFNQRLLGLTINRKYKHKISVFVYDCSQGATPRLGDTALGHELIHVVLSYLESNPHAEHFYALGSNWSIMYQDLEDEVNDKFR